jgi:hypothetical protein
LNIQQVDRSCILYGIQLQYTSALSFSNAPVATLPTDAPFPAQPQNSAFYSSQSTYSSREYTLVDKGFTNTAASLAAPYITFTDENDGSHETDEDTISSSYYVTVRYVYPRVVIKTSFDDLMPSTGFVTAVQKAMRATTKESQAAAMKRVLDNWGYVMPTFVQLGCCLTSTTDLVSTNSVRASYV